MNLWHRKVISFLQELKPNSDGTGWSWASNSKFKYVNIRVDTRNGNFLIFDDEHRRVSTEQVLWQYSKGTPEPPPVQEEYEYDYEGRSAVKRRLDVEHDAKFLLSAVLSSGLPRSKEMNEAINELKQSLKEK